MGCHFLLQGIFLTRVQTHISCASCIDRWNFSHGATWESQINYAVLCLVAQSCLTLCNLMDCSPPGSSVHGDAPGKNTGVGCHAFFQGNFPIQGLNPGLPRCRQILYQLSHKRSPRILEWEVYPFSRGSSQPSNQNRSPALQADSLPTELLGKPDFNAVLYSFTEN